uniref:GPN-loop GTPase n=1 Tax=Ditylum brightwellii TaxID=49249 RepID=A0A6U3WXC7_9STRA|mmetsp:Transcript_21353/g.31688  ORF Transcript_21353/g.31688 Transcript_21353/m.31688 type:complete len:450 (+) Transcript_21353:59-1408(+)
MSDNNRIKTTTSTGVTRFHLTEEDLEGIPNLSNDENATGGDGSSSRKNEVKEEGEDSIPILRRRRLRRRQEEDGGITSEKNDDPICVIVVGMAGSGKTTLMAQLQRSLGIAQDTKREKVEKEEHEGETEEEEGSGGGNDKILEENDRTGYCVNLDPATKLVPYGVSIDIRDTVDYKEVMKQHNLGPNGAIMTSLNLFATKFDQVMTILERRAYGHEVDKAAASEGDTATANPKNDDTNKKINYILVDTPGQIEAFTWSASGTIMGESLASSFPTVLAFVVDTPRCAASPHTFMSNMLYACSMLYRTRLPLVVVFNKTDVVSHDFAQEWMEDYEAFQEALDERNEYTDGPESTGYYGSLTRSLSLVLDEFYTTLHKCGVSAATGDGVDDFWNAVQNAANDYETDYLEDLRNRIREQKAKKGALARLGVRRLQRDLDEDNRTRGSGVGRMS